MVSSRKVGTRGRSESGEKQEPARSASSVTGDAVTWGVDADDAAAAAGKWISTSAGGVSTAGVEEMGVGVGLSVEPLVSGAGRYASSMVRHTLVATPTALRILLVGEVSEGRVSDVIGTRMGALLMRFTY